MIRPDDIGSARIHSCLGVNGDSTFQKLWVTPPALLDMVFVTNVTTPPGDGGSGWMTEFGPKFIIEDIPDEKPLVKSYYVGGTHTFHLTKNG